MVARSLQVPTEEPAQIISSEEKNFAAYIAALTPKQHPEYTLGQFAPASNTPDYLTYTYADPDAARDSVWQIDDALLGDEPTYEDNYRAYRTTDPFRNYLWDRGELIYHNAETGLAQVYYDFDAEPIRYLSDIYVENGTAWFYYQAYRNIDFEKSLAVGTLHTPYLQEHQMYQRRVDLNTGQTEDRPVYLPNQARGKAINVRFDDPTNIALAIDFFDEAGNSTGGEGYGFHLSECLKDPSLHSRVRKDDDPNVPKYEIPFVESNSVPRY